MDVDDEPRESTQAEPRQSIPPVQPGHISRIQSSSQRGTILAKEGSYVLIDWGTRIEVWSASQINEGDFDTPETGIATTFAPADDYDLLKQLKKRDQSNFVSNVESVLDTDPYRGKRVLYLVKYKGEQRKLRCAHNSLEDTLLELQAFQSRFHVVIRLWIQLSQSKPCLLAVPLSQKAFESKRNQLSNSSIQDEDYGHGLHPDADRAFLRGLTGDRKLRPTDYDVKDAIMYRSKGGSETGVYYITVFLELKGEKRNALLESREVRHYNYEGPARSSRTTFLQAGGKEEDFAGILNDRQPEMWQEYLKKREHGGAREVSPLPEGIDTGRLEARLGRLEARLETFVGMMANLMETINHRGS
ncbi:hypothetical protein DPSP01_014674 [Paraphaeosphaeria sporulosa]